MDLGEQEYTLSPSKRKEFEEAFTLFDTNNDGKVSASELGDVLRNLGARM